MRIKIAIDTNMGRKRLEELIGLGYDVVVVAQSSEKDIDWVYRAFNAGARFVVSNDGDIPRLIEKEGYPMCWIDFPADNPLYKTWLVGYVDKMIKYKIRIWKSILQEAV